MGTGIHVYVEVRYYRFDDLNWEKGVWTSVDKWTQNPYYYLYPENKEPEWQVDIEDSRFCEKNYFLFSILANVRNLEGIVPLSMPRGIPENVSGEIKRVSDSEGTDAHSHSWLTLKELLNFNWNQVFTFDGKEYSYSQCAENFLTEFIPELQRLGDKDDVRIVLWFDN
jgi:hypothetical protein